MLKKISGAVLVSMIATVSLESCRVAKKSSSLMDDNEDLQEAIAALNIIGADTPHLGNRVKGCVDGCHGADTNWHGVIDIEKVKRWGQKAQDLRLCFNEAAAIQGLSAQEIAKKKIACMYITGTNNWDTAKVGFYRVAVGSAEFVDMFKTAYNTPTDPQAYRIAYDSFFEKMIMPKKTGTQRPSDADVEKLMAWVQKGMKKMNEAFGDRKPPTSMNCKDEVQDSLVKHIAELSSDAGKEKNWSYKNLIDGKMPMIGCSKIPEKLEDLNVTPMSCFSEKRADGKEKYPLVHNDANARRWAERYYEDGKPLYQKMHIVRELPVSSSYWMRSSADGRFSASGLRGDPKNIMPSGSNGFIVDLQLDDRPMIGISANYDPGFFPDNKGFTFMQGSGGFFCNIDLIGKPISKPGEPVQYTQFVDLEKEIDKPNPMCILEKGLGVYQHVGADTGGGKYFVVRSDNYSNDNGGNAQTNDPSVGPFSKNDSILQVWPMEKKDGAFAMKPMVPITVPFEGDFGISPSSTYVTSRIAAPNKDQAGQVTGYSLGGYRLRSFTVDQENKKGTTDAVATLCIKGGKASMSFSERTLTTHHYTDEQDFIDLGYAKEDPEFKGLINNSANIWIYDIPTKRKMRLTRMGKGQFALYPHFRSDGWMYFLVRDIPAQKEYIVATDAALRAAQDE